VKISPAAKLQNYRIEVRERKKTDENEMAEKRQFNAMGGKKKQRRPSKNTTGG